MTTGLYDNQGVLRFSGQDRASCLAYAELFNLREQAQQTRDMQMTEAHEATSSVMMNQQVDDRNKAQ